MLTTSFVVLERVLHGLPECVGDGWALSGTGFQAGQDPGGPRLLIVQVKFTHTTLQLHGKAGLAIIMRIFKEQEKLRWPPFVSLIEMVSPIG